MGIENLAIFPALVGGTALLILMIFSCRNLRHLFKAVLFSIAITTCTTVVLFATVVFFESLRVASIFEDSLYIGVVGCVIYAGLKYGQMKFCFIKRELLLMGIIAFCGCMTATLCFLGWTIKI
ncbi:MAG: hypothetical protein HQK65_08800 [Desulfamplus sp.]|nr:hypothetical protein [Desulfamplus sp.]